MIAYNLRIFIMTKIYVVENYITLSQTIEQRTTIRLIILKYTEIYFAIFVLWGLKSISNHCVLSKINLASSTNNH